MIVIIGKVLFAVLIELRRMRERISLIEAKLARSRQSEHPSTVTQAQTRADCVKEEQLSTSQTASQKSCVQLSRSLPAASSTNCSTATSSQSTTKSSQVLEKPGADTRLIIGI